jgi:hypothetical protein
VTSAQLAVSSTQAAYLIGGFLGGVALAVGRACLAWALFRD